MAILSHRTELQLDGKELLSLADIRGTQLTCVDGSVWLTLDHDLRDVFLNPGDSFVVDRDGTTLLYALAPARLRIENFADAATLSAGWRRAVARAAQRLTAAVLPARLAGA